MVRLKRSRAWRVDAAFFPNPRALTKFPFCNECGRNGNCERRNENGHERKSAPVQRWRMTPKGELGPRKLLNERIVLMMVTRLPPVIVVEELIFQVPRLTLRDDVGQLAKFRRVTRPVYPTGFPCSDQNNQVQISFWLVGSKPIQGCSFLAKNHSRANARSGCRETTIA